jgi:putative Mg2+ transporter-C (MgtC) family protein
VIIERVSDLPSLAELTSALRLDLLLKLALAVVLGGAIGLEREIAGKPAGLRTNILICIGAALLSDISVNIGRTESGTYVGDPARLAAQIVSGIGFIGAGTIMQARGVVTGLTSAATIWVVAAIGIAIGAGFYIEAAGAGILVTGVLAGLGTLEYRLRRARRVVNCTVRAKPFTPMEVVESILDPAGIRILNKGIYDHPEDRTFELRLAGPARQFDLVQDMLARNEHILDVHLG